MANKNNIDYTQVDQILHGMFTPVKEKSFEFETTGDYNNLKMYYGQVNGISFNYFEYFEFHSYFFVFILNFAL